MTIDVCKRKTDDAVVPNSQNEPAASTSKDTKPFDKKRKSQQYADAAEVKGLHLHNVWCVHFETYSVPYPYLCPYPK